jgi:thiosulfate/3-mercaptopyruvate sulfurtransferase
VNDQVSSRSLVTPAWLEAHLSDPSLRIIDVAGLNQDEMQAYKAGHVPGAQCWLWKEALWDSHKRDFPDPAEFSRRMAGAGIGNDTRVVIYGEDIQFGVYGWWTLRYCGHEKVSVLDGGRHRWAAEGRSLQHDLPPPPKPVIYRPVARNEQMRIFRDDVLAAVENGRTTILDARSPEEYRGERVGPPSGPDSGAVRAGRIPGAQHLFFLELMDDHKAFKSAAELAPLIDKMGLKSDDPIIVYCRMSHRATVAYFALHELLGFNNVKVYDGSWTEWGNLVGVPVEH